MIRFNESLSEHLFPIASDLCMFVCVWGGLQGNGQLLVEDVVEYGREDESM